MATNMTINVITQQPSEFIQFTAAITSNANNQITIPPCTYQLYEYNVTIPTSTNINVQDGTQIWLTNQGIVVSNVNQNASNYTVADLLGYVNGNTLTYIIHPIVPGSRGI
jgi:hypothetical protein